jgi:hypothetical protein
MLRDRGTPVDLFALVPALALRFEPELAELDRLLVRRTPRGDTGAPDRQTGGRARAG